MPDQLDAIIQKMIDAGESEDAIASVIRSYRQPSESNIGAFPLKAISALGGATGPMMDFATNPNVPKAAASAGRVIGGAAPVLGGAYGTIKTGNPLDALLGVTTAAKGAWAGGKTGWFTGKLLQALANPVAKGLEAAAPALNVASGAQGALDLAQMADPQRRDIGILGIGASNPPQPTNEETRIRTMNAGESVNRQDVLAAMLKSLLLGGEQPEHFRR